MVSSLGLIFIVLSSCNRVDPKTFYPTLEEMSDLVKYIEFMESQGAHK